jgi:hypothetical protein
MDGEPRPLPGGRGRKKQSSILADRRQRRILSVLASASQPMSVDELCRRLAAMDHDDADTTGSIRIDLRHRCLPGLEAVGWIKRRPDGLRLGETPFAESVPVSTPPLRTPDDPLWDVVSALLARPYRRHVLVTVAERDGHLTVEELAVELRERADVLPGRADDERPLPINLHHADLPKLAAVGAIEYDRDGRAAAPTDRLSTYLDRLKLDG